MPTPARSRAKPATARTKPTTTTTTRAKTTAARAREHSEWRHGPVGAAINASIGALVAAALIRLLHLAPVWPLVAGVFLAIALTTAGIVRRPRRLAARSLVYRSTAMLTAGTWVWERSVDFSQVGAGAMVAAITCLASAAATAAALIGYRTGHRRIAFAAALTAIATGVTGAVSALASHLGSVFLDAGRLGRSNYESWLTTSTLTLLVFAAAFAVVGAACANHEHDLDATPVGPLLRRPAGGDLVVMQNLLREINRDPQLRITAMERWPNGAGENYVIDCRLSGMTHVDMAGRLDMIAARLDLPDGCGAESLKGKTRGQMVLAVSRVNKIADDHPYPTTYVQRSVYNGLPIGVYRDASIVELKIRENSVFCWGQKRSGKTTTLYDLVAGLHQCTDAMIWVIDFGGGGVALPFLYPYAEGKVDRPGIDWVATTLEEADMMADHALKIATDRKTFYKHRKRKANTNLLPLDAGVPEIVIVIDEGAEVMGLTANSSYLGKMVRDKLEKIVRIAGDSGVNIVFSGLAATAEVIDRMILAQLGIRIGMRVSEARELGYGFGEFRLNPDDAPFQGSGFAKASHDDTTRPFKSYLITPDQMADVAIATADWRPFLDKRGVELGGRNYAERWHRTAHLLADEEGNVLIDVGAGHPVIDGEVVEPAPAAGPVPAARPADDADSRAAAAAFRDQYPFAPPPKPLPTQEELRDVNFTAACGPPPPDATVAGTSVEQLMSTPVELAPMVEQFRAQLDDPSVDWGDPTTWPAPPGAAPAGVEDAAHPEGPAVLEKLVLSHGTDGIRARDIPAKLSRGGSWGPSVRVTQQTIHNWLAAPPDRTPAAWLAARAKGGPYVHRDAR